MLMVIIQDCSKSKSKIFILMISAVIMALKLNEANLVQHAVESIPVKDSKLYQSD